ncbi:MAG: hypothetical protein H7842_12855, partial [Gammaproteobacteria bacterium SHHR-1]
PASGAGSKCTAGSINGSKPPPVSFDDAKKLAQVYAHGVTVSDDLLEAIVERVDGSVRYCCINLARIRDEALVLGEDRMGLGQWGGRGFYSDHSEGQPE